DEILSTLANVQTEHSPMPESDIREEPKCTFVNTLDYIQIHPLPLKVNQLALMMCQLLKIKNNVH
ncbi:hypothetical protein NMV36_11760, partial [Pasteurella multocida]|nr:hypothetical protein [Pasteurella multocida]